MNCPVAGRDVELCGNPFVSNRSNLIASSSAREETAMHDSFRLSAILTLCVGLCGAPATAQQAPLRDQLAGTWTMVSSTGRFGANPKGQMILLPNGRFSFMISRADMPKFAVNNVNQGTAEENAAVVKGVIASFGTWSVDEATKTLTTNVEASTFPNLSGNSQKRTITSLTADELKYTNPTSVAGTVDEGVWKRVK